jgi:hypothetical protein
LFDKSENFAPIKLKHPVTSESKDDEISFGLRQGKHFYTVRIPYGEYGSRVEFKLNKEIIEWLKENEIKYTWHGGKNKKARIMFGNKDNAMRFKLTWA